MKITQICYLAVSGGQTAVHSAARVVLSLESPTAGIKVSSGLSFFLEALEVNPLSSSFRLSSEFSSWGTEFFELYGTNLSF